MGYGLRGCIQRQEVVAPFDTPGRVRRGIGQRRLGWDLGSPGAVFGVQRPCNKIVQQGIGNPVRHWSVGMPGRQQVGQIGQHIGPQSGGAVWF